MIKVNLIGTFNVLRLAATAMTENDPVDTGERGVCINTASIAAYDGQIGQNAYASSKGGVVGMTLPAARDLASRGIRVLTVAPGRSTPRCSRPSRRKHREALGEGSRSPPARAARRSTPSTSTHIVENPMLNGEAIRLDGALRMPP